MKKLKYGLFFGDSITYGEYDFIYGGWVDILKRYALKKFQKGSDELILFNLGIGGETTKGLINRISPELSARNAEGGNFVFLSYGANDLAQKEGFYQVNSLEFENNILNAIKIARAYTQEIFLVSILPVSNLVDGVLLGSGKIRTNVDVLSYNDILKKIAKKENLEYIDFHKLFFEDKEFLLSKDGVHPNEKGYELMANHVISIIDSFF